MVRYPHTITLIVKADATQSPTTGLFTAGTSKTYTFEGRAEPNGKGQRVKTYDGSIQDYSFDFYMPLTTVKIPEGTRYTLSTGEEGMVKYAWNTQYITHLWL